MKKEFVILFFTLLVNNIIAQVNVLQVEQITTRDGLPQNSVQSIIQDKYGFMWFSSFASICKYDGYKFTQYYPEPDNPNTLYSSGIYNIVLDSAKNVWIGFFTSPVYCKYNYETDDFSRVPENETDKLVQQKIDRGRQPIYSANNVPDVIWKFQDGYVFEEDNLSGTEKKYCLDFTGIQPFTINMISSMFLDKYGILWVGTEKQGVYKINTNTKPFYSYYNVTEYCNHFISDIIRDVFVDNEEMLWLGTFSNGIIKINKNNNKIFYMKYDPLNRDNCISNNEIRDIFQDSTGEIWIGTKGGVTRYNPNTNQYKFYTRYTAEKIPSPWVHSFMEDHNGIIWIGTFYGFVQYERATDKYQFFDPNKYLKSPRISKIIEDKHYNVWISTQGGGITCLKRVDSGKDYDTIHYLNIPNDPKSLSSNRVFGLLEDNYNNIWASTDYGLCKLNPKTAEFTRYNMKNGLPDDMIMGILLDKHDNIWISHKKGITKLNTHTGEMQHYSEQDGLQSNDFSENACYKDPKTGEMFFGNAYGFNSFFPDSIKNNLVEPDIYFTGLKVLNQDITQFHKLDGKTILSKSILTTKKLILSNKHKNFSIEFAGLHYVKPEANIYKYKLEGFDEKWLTGDASHRMVTYSNLPAGKYVLRVKTANGDGIWSNKEAKMEIVIKPPWWNTFWAYLFYFFILIVILFWIYRYIIEKERFKNQLRYEKMKAKKLLELDQLKIQFFTNVSHELRTPLTLLIDPLQKLKGGNVESGQVSYYYSLMYNNAQRLMKLVNQLLDFRRIENKKYTLETELADIAAYIGNVADAFRINAMHRNIRFEYIARPSKIMANFDPDKIEKIVFNLLSNAFKYTPDGRSISIMLQLNNNENDNLKSKFIEIKVIDSGIGIPANAVNKIFDVFYQAKLPVGYESIGTGIGLALTKELVELLKGKIDVESKENIGSTFTVKLPLETVEINESEINKSELLSEGELTENNNVNLNNELKEGKEIKYDIPFILLIEDNEDVRNYLRSELSRDYNVLEAGNGKEGMQIALEETPDIIISDIMMPIMDGLEFCKRLKNDTRISHIPVILLTARHSETFVVEGYEIGADAYITKPFNTNILKARIKNLIESRNILLESFGKTPFLDLKKVANNTADEEFLNKTVEIIHQYISEPEFNIDLLAEYIKMNRRQLTHKIKTLTGQTVNEFVKTIRLNKAAELLLTTDYAVSEIAYQLGYNVPANFSRSFTKQFGKSPTEYIASFNKDDE